MGALLAGCAQTHHARSTSRTRAGTAGASSARPRRSVARVPRFAVFGSRATPADALSHEAAAALARSPSPGFTRWDLGMARRVLPDAPGWLVPAADGEVCLVDVVYATVRRLEGAVLPPAVTHDCASEVQAQAGRLVESQSLTAGVYAQRARVTGVAADGVESVTVLSRGRAAVVVPVMRNAYQLVVRDPVAVRFALRRGARHAARTIPLAVVQARNATPATADGTLR